VDDLNQSTALTGQDERHPGREKEKGKMFDMTYDKLVIAVGCYSQTFNTPGVKEHALFLKDVGDARKIRTRLLACFETAALPTTSVAMKKNLLNFAVVGGGPTGIEFSAELHDLVREDLKRSYPDLIKYVNITVYDVAPQVLPMFDKKLAAYAMNEFRRDGIKIKTEHHVESLRRGVPKSQLSGDNNIKDDQSCWTLKIKEEGEVGVGMVVWSTGLMMNPLIAKQLGKVHTLPRSAIDYQNIDKRDVEEVDWTVKKHERTGGIVSDAHLRLILEPQGGQENKPRAIVKDVFALGDCAVLEGTMYPGTAQVASQKAGWLAKRLNQGDIETQAFRWKDMGIMAYLGNWNAIVQSGPGEITGRAAWFIWRGAYLTKSVSWRNKILIPTYCEYLLPYGWWKLLIMTNRVSQLVIWEGYLKILSVLYAPCKKVYKNGFQNIHKDPAQSSRTITSAFLFTNPSNRTESVAISTAFIPVVGIMFSFFAAPAALNAIIRYEHMNVMIAIFRVG
jgi:NADH dehydrogenase FAD-containing subunit